MGQRKPNATTAASLLRALILEDNPLDAQLMVRALERGGFKVKLEVTDSAEVFQECLGKAEYDVILADFNLRGWTAFDALEILKRTGKDIPLIVDTGSLGDEAAAECIKRGAADFILKDRPARLPAAVQRALEEKQLRIERKRAEEELKAERNLLHTLMDNIPDFIYFKDRSSRFTRVNLALAKHLGVDHPAQVSGKTDADFFAPDNAQEFSHDEEEIIRTGLPMVGKEEKAVFPDGHETWFSTTKMPLRDSNGNIIGTYGVNRDITEHKRAEMELRRLNRALRTLGRCNEILVRAQSVPELFASVCQSLVEIGGYRMAWVGLAEDDERKTIRPVAHAGLEDGYLGLQPFTWGDGGGGMGPTGSAIRSGMPVINRNTETNATMEPWRAEALQRGYASSIALPLRTGSHSFGAITLYAIEADAFDEMEVKLLSELAGDLAYGTDTLRIRVERIGADAALRKSEERYRALFERNLAGVFVSTWDGRVLDCNQAMVTFLGFNSLQEAKAIRVPDLYFSKEERADFLARLEADGRLSNYEMRLRRQDGNVVWLIGNISVRTDPSSGLRIIEGTLIDVTERKLAEAENARLAQIVNSSGDAIFSTTRDGLISTWNAGAERMFGYAAEEINGKHFSILVPEARRSDLSSIRARLFQGEALLPHENDSVRKDGSNLPVLLTLSPLRDEKGSVTGVSVIARDITERQQTQEALRKSEEKYRSIVSNIPDVVWTLAENLRFVFISKNIEKVSGFSLDEIDQVGAGLFLASLHPDDVAKVQSGLRALFAEGQPYDVEVRTRRKNGEWIWVHDRAVATYEKNGVKYADGLLSDITERKKAEQELLLKTALLEAQSETTIDGILAVDTRNQVLLSNRQFAEMWGIPDAVIASKDDRQVLQLVLNGVTDEDKFLQRVKYLYTHGTEKSFDEIGLKDGRVFDRYSSPLLDSTGTYLGRIWYFRDITKRKRAEEALRLSEAHLAAGERLTHTGSWSWNVATGELFWSQETYRIFGFDPAKDSASIRDTFLARIHPEDRAIVEAGLQNPSAQASVEYRIVLPDGSIRFIHDIAYPVTDAAGNTVQRFGVASDITERKRADEALRQSEERFRQIAETIEEVFWTSDPVISRMLYISPAYERIWGRPCATLYENPKSFLDSIHPDDRDRVVSVLQAQVKGEPFDHEYRIITPGGVMRWIWDRGFPVRDEAGRVIRYVGVAVDISARKRAEAERIRLVTAIEQSAEAVVITNPSGEIEYVNPAFTRITGYSREEALGQNPRILKSERQDPAFYHQLWETILTGNPWSGELINQRKDKSLYTEQMSIAPVKGAQGEITHFIATKQDVTERRTMEAQLQQAAKMEAVGRLAGGVAHDFNNLLTVINGYSEILLGRLADDEKASPFLQEIFSAGERAAALTRQLLAFSRRQVLAPQVLDLNAVVLNLEKMLRRLIGEDVKLRTNLDPNLERVKADPGQIEQVIMNLAVNARDAMPMGGNLTLETSNVVLDEGYARNHPTVKPGPHVMLAVSDTGVGMSPQTQARIFEPFFTTKEIGIGTGLGLATVYGIVKQSGGSIWVYSEVGKGTAFKVYLPMASDSQTEVAPLITAKDPATGTETILVVEDEEGVRSLVRVALASGGYHVLEAKDAETAMALCADHSGPIHLLLTDVVMPQMSGPALAKRLIAIRHDIKVLYMSGYTDDAVVHHGVLSHDTPFIQKPFSPVALRKKVHEVLGGISPEEPAKT
jgi:PAS domain S-box-containing protein